MLPRAFVRAGMLLAVPSIVLVGCVGGFFNENLQEGDRCNPLDSHNECSSGLVCTGQGSSPTIPFCPENYCCSVDGNGNIDSTNVFCQPGCNGGADAICKAAMAGNPAADPNACVFTGAVEAGSEAGSE